MSIILANFFSSLNISIINRATAIQIIINEINLDKLILSFSIKTAGHINLSIYDITGRLVSTLVDGNMEQGYHSIIWNGLNSNGNAVTSGMYIYALKGEGIALTKKMVLMK